MRLERNSVSKIAFEANLVDFFADHWCFLSYDPYGFIYFTRAFELVSWELL